MPHTSSEVSTRGTQGTVEIPASVVHPDRELPEFGDRRLSETIVGGPVEHVHAQREGVPATRPHLLRHRLHLVRASRRDCDVRAGLGKGQSDPAANAASPTGDHGYVPVEAELIENTHAAVSYGIEAAPSSLAPSGHFT